jgi:anti-sigma-K factor RskA
MKEEELRHIRREMEAWATQPPALSPRVARTRVVTRLEKRRRPRGWRIAVASVSAVAVLALGLLFLPPERFSDPTPMAIAEQPRHGLLVYELRSGSKLYFALSPEPAHFSAAPNGKQKNGD